MDAQSERTITTILDDNRVMTIATLRPDGWPQTTTVGFAHEGLTLYFLCGPDSQKARNLARDDRVSLTVDHDTPQVMDIRGLSMAARARRITDPDEAGRVLGLLLARYPEQSVPGDLPTPRADDLAVFRLEPTVISLIDYSKGFGHTDLVTLRG